MKLINYVVLGLLILPLGLSPTQSSITLNQAETTIQQVDFDRNSASAGETVHVLANVTTNSPISYTKMKITGSTGLNYTNVYLYWNNSLMLYEGSFDVNQYWTSEIYISELYVYSDITEKFINTTDFTTPVLSLINVTPDIEAPVVYNIWTNPPSNSINVVEQHSLFLYVNMSDVYGYTRWTAYFEYINGTDFDTIFSNYPSCKTVDNLEYCTLGNSISFNKFKDEGIIYLKKIVIYDGLGNKNTLVNGTDFNTTQFTFELKGRVEDNLAPLIKDMFFVYTYTTYQTGDFDVIHEAYYGDKNSMYLILDWDFGLAEPTYATIAYTMNGVDFDPNFYEGYQIQKNRYSGLWVANIGIANNTYRGEGLVQISQITVQDKAGNSAKYTEDTTNFPSFWLMNATRKVGEFTATISDEEKVIENDILNMSVVVEHTFDLNLQGVSLSAMIMRDDVQFAEISINNLEFVNQRNITTLSFTGFVSGKYTLILNITDDIGREWTFTEQVFVTSSQLDDTSSDVISDVNPASFMMYSIFPLILLGSFLRRRR